jgi:predicted membrane protein
MDASPACSPFDSPRHRARRALFGLSVVGIGSLALLDNLHVVDTPLLHTFWPLVFVLWGIGRLVWRQHLSGRLFGVVLIVVGALMTAHNLGHAALDLHHWWPVFVILAGVAIVLRGVLPHPHPRHRFRRRFESSSIEHSDEVNVDANFSGLKLQNDSRSFKGGRIAVNFGGLELDLREAVMEAPEATLTINASFSGIEIRVPRDWQVSVQMSASLGAVQDKSAPPVSPQHRLVLRGETMFGGVEIKN